VYPAHDEFVRSVSAEANDVVRRLRHHPSLALFCGNNEGISFVALTTPSLRIIADYQMIHQWPDVPRLPARKLYEDVLPSAVSLLSKDSIPYHPGSPYAEGCLTVRPDGREICDTADPTCGDVHQWDIWGGRERPWQDYDKMGGRFVR
jgi:beta-mannosidase